MKDTDPGNEKKKKTREQRLASQLRANLARRKSQARDRRDRKDEPPAVKTPR